MNTVQIREEIKREFDNDNPLFTNYFADAVESANNSAIDSTAEAFGLGEYDGIEFWEDGVNGIEDEELRQKINVYYFTALESALRTKTKSIVTELA